MAAFAMSSWVVSHQQSCHWICNINQFLDRFQMSIYFHCCEITRKCKYNNIFFKKKNLQDLSRDNDAMCSPQGANLGTIFWISGLADGRFMVCGLWFSRKIAHTSVWWRCDLNFNCWLDNSYSKYRCRIPHTYERGCILSWVTFRCKDHPFSVGFPL